MLHSILLRLDLWVYAAVFILFGNPAFMLLQSQNRMGRGKDIISVWVFIIWKCGLEGEKR